MATPVQVKDLGLGQLKADTAALQRQSVTVGFQGASGQAPHPNADGEKIAQVAAWMEFGTPGSDDRAYDRIRAMVPSRPFIRTMFTRHRAEIAAKIKVGLQDLLAGRATLAEIQQRLGEFLVEKAREAILDADGWATPLAASTVERKGHADPLIESGAMYDAVSWAVRDGDAIVRQGDP